MSYHCPDCGKQLQPVCQSNGSYLNSDQFDAVKAGDWYCEYCPGDRGKTGYRYFWNYEIVEMLEPKKEEIKVPDGYRLVPEQPTEEQWGGLARTLILWLDAGRPSGSNLYQLLDNLGIDVPDWLSKEIPRTDSVPSKGTRAAVIYKAMLEDAPKYDRD